MSPATEVIAIEKLASAKPVEQEFAEYLQNIETLKHTAETLVVLSEDDTEGMQLARETRLSLRAIRIDVEKRRKDLKEDALRRGQKIDAAAKTLSSVIEPLEARLMDQEKFAERAAKARAKELHASRLADLQAIGAPGHLMRPDLGTMADADWNSLLNDAQALAAARLAQQVKEEEERAAAAKAAEMERERRELELAGAKAKAERERKAREEAEAETRAAQEKAAAAEREAARVAREAAAAEAKRQAEESARIAAEAEATRRAAMAPDVEKIRAFAASITAGIPDFKDETVRAQVTAAIRIACARLEQIAAQ